MYSPNDPADHISIEAHENKMEFYHKRDAEQRDLIARLQLEAQAHAQEARTANATIAEIYQVVSGGKGEPGNWHGAEPVRTVMQKQREEIRLLSEQVNAANKELVRRAEEIELKDAQIVQLIQQCSKTQGERDYYKQELNQSHKTIERLQRALSRLRHEVAGVLYMRQHEIRNVVGDTNFACLEQRMRDAEQALTQEPT